ncbi:hypothetical protein RIVM261_070450 [Rivularia sp. IAM M-261]|nr:hypothetical protein RIVM261_070450 [Rivularia sp. IAM M-261]
MKENEQQRTLDLLQSIMEYELAGVVRYTHFSLVVTGTQRNFIVDFLKEQAAESLTHAQKVGEILVSVEGHPKPGIASVTDIDKYSIKNVLVASLAHVKIGKRGSPWLLSRGGNAIGSADLSAVIIILMTVISYSLHSAVKLLYFACSCIARIHVVYDFLNAIYANFY